MESYYCKNLFLLYTVASPPPALMVPLFTPGWSLLTQSFCHAHYWNLPLCRAVHMVTLLLDPKTNWRESGPLPLLYNCVQNSKIEL